MAENKSKRIYGQRVADEQAITVTLANIFWNEEEDGTKSLAISHRDNRLRTETGEPLDKQFTSIRFYEHDKQNLGVFIKELKSFYDSIPSASEEIEEPKTATK